MEDVAKIKVLFINNAEGGYPKWVEIAAGTNVEAFRKVHNGGDAADFKVRVNREPVAEDYVLQDGDRVSSVPKKVAGA